MSVFSTAAELEILLEIALVMRLNVLFSSAPHTVYDAAKPGHSNIISAANYGL